MGHGVGPYLGLDEIGSPSPMMVFIIINYLFNCTFWICPIFTLHIISISRTNVLNLPHRPSSGCGESWGEGRFRAY